MSEWKLTAVSLSAVIPKTPLGVNVCSGTALAFKVGGAIYYYGMAKLWSAGKKTGTQILASVETNWLPIESSEKRIKIIPNMDNQLARLEIDGLVPAYGNIDIKFTLYDSYNSPIITIERVNEPAKGILLASFSITDRLKLMRKN